jgi:hypothetical protein
MSQELGLWLAAELPLLRLVDRQTGERLLTDAERADAERERADAERMRVAELEAELARLLAVQNRLEPPA